MYLDHKKTNKPKKLFVPGFMLKTNINASIVFKAPESIRFSVTYLYQLRFFPLIKSKYTLKMIEFKPDKDKLSTLNLNT